MPVSPGRHGGSLHRLGDDCLYLAASHSAWSVFPGGHTACPVNGAGHGFGGPVLPTPHRQRLPRFASRRTVARDSRCRPEVQAAVPASARWGVGDECPVPGSCRRRRRLRTLGLRCSTRSTARTIHADIRQEKSEPRRATPSSSLIAPARGGLANRVCLHVVLKCRQAVPNPTADPHVRNVDGTLAPPAPQRLFGDTEVLCGLLRGK